MPTCSITPKSSRNSAKSSKRIKLLVTAIGIYRAHRLAHKLVGVKVGAGADRVGRGEEGSVMDMVMDVDLGRGQGTDKVRGMDTDKDRGRVRRHREIVMKREHSLVNATVIVIVIAIEIESATRKEIRRGKRTMKERILKIGINRQHCQSGVLAPVVVEEGEVVAVAVAVVLDRLMTLDQVEVYAEKMIERLNDVDDQQ